MSNPEEDIVVFIALIMLNPENFNQHPFFKKTLHPTINHHINKKLIFSQENEIISFINHHINRYSHSQPQYILISEPGQPFRSQFVLYRMGLGLIKQTINRTSRCNKVDAVRLYASYRLNLLLLKGQRCVRRCESDTPIFKSESL